ncbi:MAG TPA: hypothetical protein V6D19_11025 [Stenomitos sp.]
MHCYTVPCINTDHLEKTDLEKLSDPSRDPTEVCCMCDPQDKAKGIFLWIDEPDESSEVPQGYSERFVALWKWAQQHGYVWLRLADWGDEIDELDARTD